MWADKSYTTSNYYFPLYLSEYLYFKKSINFLAKNRLDLGLMSCKCNLRLIRLAPHYDEIYLYLVADGADGSDLLEKLEYDFYISSISQKEYLL